MRLFSLKVGILHKRIRRVSLGIDEARPGKHASDKLHPDMSTLIKVEFTTPPRKLQRFAPCKNKLDKYFMRSKIHERTSAVHSW
eukprot:TRINITY_DN6656_c0_g1_i1.p3 TRINITY_DN6656_c0_g1~~TRINITY_DN6656_c0_g1_i1.p3  ORF type:complete len:84 (-),score=6.27 TRINITY_DN6656_c0_g1_i1:31-282(-)